MRFRSTMSCKAQECLLISGEDNSKHQHEKRARLNLRLARVWCTLTYHILFEK